MYNYYEAVKEDVLEYIKNEINFAEFETLEDLGDFLNETLWANDSVTGNGSGSYTFNAWEAEENIAHNLDLLCEALEAFGQSLDCLLTEGAEAADVTIRCYLLSDTITETLEEIAEDFNTAHEDEKIALSS